MLYLRICGKYPRNHHWRLKGKSYTCNSLSNEIVWTTNQASEKRNRTCFSRCHTMRTLRQSLCDLHEPVFFLSMLTYSFVWSGLASYVSKTTWQLLQKIKRHKPAWLRTGTRKFVNGVIVAHLADTWYQVNDEVFKVIYKEPRNSSRASFSSTGINSNQAVKLIARFTEMIYQIILATLAAIGECQSYPKCPRAWPFTLYRKQLMRVVYFV